MGREASENRNFSDCSSAFSDTSTDSRTKTKITDSNSGGATGNFANDANSSVATKAFSISIAGCFVAEDRLLPGGIPGTSVLATAMAGAGARP